MALAPNAAYSLLQARKPTPPTPLHANYNPYAYVPGGSSTQVATAIQNKGYSTGYKPGLAPNTGYNLLNPRQTTPTPPPGTSPPSDTSSQQNAANSGAGAPPGEGVYAQDSAAAYDAYNAAIAAADKETSNARLQYGFNAEGSNLDPSNSTGLIQRLMHQQSQTSMDDAENALGDGLGSTGLGAQRGEAHNFQNQADMADATQGYQSLLAQALAHKGDAGTTLTNTLLAARQRQIELDIQNQMFQAWAAQNGDGSGGSDNTDGTDTTQPPVVDHTPDALSRFLANSPVLPKPKPKVKSVTSGGNRGVH